MRGVFIILLFSLNATAQTYYVSNAGSNAANGTSTGTSWQTATYAFLNAPGGSSISFKRGDTFTVSATIRPQSNTSVAAYGSGVKPVFTAFQTATGWTNVGNIWSATLTNSVPKLNTVLINGDFAAKGRYPNTGYLTFTSYVGKGQITGSLTGTPNYTGGEAVVRSAHWILDVVKINSQSTGTLYFRDSLTYTPTFGGNGYFIQNIESVLDVQNEWCIDSATKVIKVYSTTQPILQYSTVDTLFWVNNKTAFLFDNVTIIGANTAAIKIDSSNNISVKYSTIKYSGREGISATKSYRVTLQYDSVINSWNRGMYLGSPLGIQADNCDTSFVDYNYIRNSGIEQGMGANANGMSTGLLLVGRATTAIGNEIDSVGYNAINFNGNTLVKNNLLKNYCLTKDDGGGIYTFLGGGTGLASTYNIGAIVRGNIIINGDGASAGTSTASMAPGLYCDLGSSGMTWDSNTVINSYSYSVAFVGPGTVILRDNNFYNTVGGGWYSGPQGGGPFTLKKNTFYVSDSTKYTVYAAYAWTGFAIDSNYYLRPIKEANQFTIPSTVYNFAAYKAATGLDANSQLTPSGVLSNPPIIPYNPTDSDSTVSLDGTYKDAGGQSYINSIMIPAHRSAILFKVSGVTPITPRSSYLRFKLKGVRS